MNKNIALAICYYTIAAGIEVIMSIFCIDEDKHVMQITKFQMWNEGVATE